MTTEKAVKRKLKELDKFLLDEYKEKFSFKRKNPRDYEKKFLKRIKFAIKNMNPLIEKVTSEIKIKKEKGRPAKLSLKQKLILILLKQLVGKSNRMMAYLLDIFFMVFGIEISYKTIERLYSDDGVKFALHNLCILILKEKEVTEINSCGDATGYSLTIKTHYQTYASKFKEKSKVAEDKKRKFVYKFALMDLDSKMYVCYGSSLKSEKDAYNKAMEMLKTTEIKIKSLRLDRYYSNPGDINKFHGCKIYFIPKKNVTMQNGLFWNERLTEFVEDTFGYLKEYFKRNNSESGFAEDKKLLGWKITQKREDRIDTSILAKVVWRNLFHLYS